MISTPPEIRNSSRLLASLSAIYLVLPAFIFAWGWLRWPYALVTTLAAGGFMALAAADVLRALWADRPRVRDLLRTFWPALLVVLIWVSLSGIGGFGLQNGDYFASNALFKGLIVQPWPLRTEFHGVTANVVYYVGYYLPAAAFGKLFGWTAANVFLFAWSLAGVWLAFLWFWRISRVRPGRVRLLVLALVFCLASGMDVAGYYLLHHNSFDWGLHIETWNPFFQFSSQATLLYWVPQQALAAWLMAGLVHACLEEPGLFRYLGMSLAAGILWSPFGVVGLLPYLLALGVVLLRRGQFRVLLAPGTLLPNLASLWVGAIHSLYISSNRYDFPAGLLWDLAENHRYYLAEAAGFWSLEFGFVAMAVAVLWGLIVRRRRVDESPAPAPSLGWFALVCLSLTGLLLFKMGLQNDLVMRASIPSLLYLWAFTAWTLVEAAAFFKSRPVKVMHALVVCLLLIGSYTSFSEVGRGIFDDAFGPTPAGEIGTIAGSSPDQVVVQRLGRDDTFFYRYLSR